MLRIDPLGFANGGLTGNGFVPPHVPACLHAAGIAGALVNEYGLDRALLAAQCDALVNGRLEREPLAAPQLPVGGDDRYGARVLDALLQALCRKAAEHDRMNRSDAGAGLHGHHAFDRHRHVDDDAVTLFDAMRLQGIGQHGRFVQ